MALRAEGVDSLFGYPGGANLEIFDVLHQFESPSGPWSL